jgi:hypothetical protein
LVVGAVLGLMLLVARRASGGGTSDVEERRAEHVERQRAK